MTTPTARSVWREIAPRVFVRRYEFLDQTIPVVLGDRAALVVDTRSTLVQARELLAELRSLAPDLRPIEDGGLVVVNSHHHWDHTFGNAAFRPARIWGHVRCATRIREQFAGARARIAAELPELTADLADVTIDPPDRTFEASASLEVGGRPFVLRYLGRGHTDDDIVVIVPDAAAVLVGDLVEEGAPPSFGDSFPLDWAATLAHVLDLADSLAHEAGGRSEARVVPGHGEVVDRTFVEAQLADIAALAECGRRAFASSGTLDDVLRDAPFPEAVSRVALERTFAQLRGEL